MNVKNVGTVKILRKIRPWAVLAGSFAAALLFFGVSHFRSSGNVPKALSALSEDDKNALEWFFRDLIDSACAYVLFGNKPMSICSFLEIESNLERDPVNELRDLFSRFCVQQLKINRGFHVWKKYQHCFPSSNFLLLENRDSSCITMVMIHKHNFLNKIEENIDLFRKILGAHVTPRTILDDCLQSSDIFKDVLKNRDELIGVLLGYGRHNSELFARRTEIERRDEPREISLNQKSLISSNGFPSVEDEHRYIRETLKGAFEVGRPDLNPLLIPLPGFVADLSHPETQRLKVEYTKQYKKIIKNYRNGDFLEITLKQFCGY